MATIQTDVVLARALEEAVRSVLQGDGHVIAVTPAELDLTTGAVTRYLIVRQGGPPWIARPEDR